jgi:hypothetical protein
VSRRSRKRTQPHRPLDRHFAIRKRASRERELAVPSEQWDATPESEDHTWPTLHDAAVTDPSDGDEASWPAACTRGMQ